MSRTTESSAWNFAHVWETVALGAPDRLAQVHGSNRITWAAFDAIANGFAASMLHAGAAHQDKVALYLHNGPAYLQAAFGCMKAGLVPVNTNYRYQDDELVYLWDNCDAAAVVFHGAFADRVAAVRARCRKVCTWIHVDDGAAPCPAWALPYAQVAAPQTGRVEAPWARSPWTGGPSW